MTDGETIMDALATKQSELYDAVEDEAGKEFDYRQARAVAWIQHSEAKTATERTVMADSDTAEHRKKRDIARGYRSALIEEIRTLRQQLSYLQTMANADRPTAF